jgi:hypothetical protein
VNFKSPVFDHFVIAAENRINKVNMIFIGYSCLYFILKQSKASLLLALTKIESVRLKFLAG